MSVRLPRIFLPADGLNDVLAIKHPNQPIDTGHLGQEAGLMTLNKAAGYNHPLALALGLHIQRFADGLE